MSFSGSGSAASSGNLRFASAEEIEARLRRHFPTIDSEVLKDFSFAISRGRYLYNDAKKMLKELVVISSVQSAVVDAIEEEKKVQQQQRREEEQQRKQHAEVRRQLQQEQRVGSSSQQPPPPQPNNNTYDPRQHQPHRATPASASSLSSSSSAAAPAPAVVSAASNAMELDPSLAYVQPHEAVLYHTTMTASRQVRYHCRLMLNLLYMRRVQFKEFDVADNVFIQRQLQRLTGLGGAGGGGGSRGGRGDEQLQLPLPLLFVGESFVGTYETCQELEDNDRLLDKMVSLGFHYVPAPLTTQQQQNPSHRFNDDDDEDEDYFDEQKRGGYRSGGPQQTAGAGSGQRWFD